MGEPTKQSGDERWARPLLELRRAAMEPRALCNSGLRAGLVQGYCLIIVAHRSCLHARMSGTDYLSHFAFVGIPRHDNQVECEPENQKIGDPRATLSVPQTLYNRRRLRSPFRQALSLAGCNWAMVGIVEPKRFAATSIISLPGNDQGYVCLRSAQPMMVNPVKRFQPD